MIRLPCSLDRVRTIQNQPSAANNPTTDATTAQINRLLEPRSGTFVTSAGRGEVGAAGFAAATAGARSKSFAGSAGVFAVTVVAGSLGTLLLGRGSARCASAGVAASGWGSSFVCVSLPLLVAGGATTGFGAGSGAAVVTLAKGGGLTAAAGRAGEIGGGVTVVADSVFGIVTAALVATGKFVGAGRGVA